MNLPNLELTGILLVFAGIFVLVASVFLQSKNNPQSKTQSGGVVLIGPFPIAFGSFKSKEGIKILQIAGIAIVIIYALWLFLFRR